jgi:hypothetical protein
MNNEGPAMKKIIQVRISKGEKQYVAECLTNSGHFA